MAKYHCKCVIYVRYHRVWFLSACAYIPTAREVGLIIQDTLSNQEKIKWVWLTLLVDLHIDLYQDVWSTSEDGASCQQHYSSVIRQRVTVASSMFTRMAGAGSAEARRARTNGAQNEAQRAGAEARIEGQSRECGGSIGDSKMRHCYFIAPALSRKHQALSVLCHYRSRYRAFFFDQKCMRLTRSTKDRKKGAYDPGALNKQDALKNQTLRYYSARK